MKQLFADFRNGRVFLDDVPPPMLRPQGALIFTRNSAVSVGTERSVLEFSAKTIIGKATSRPDLVSQVLQKVREEGIVSAYNTAIARLENYLPLGYSASGDIAEIGEQLRGHEVGDRVAAGGGGYACHAEINYVPKNLIVKLPDNVTYEEGAFATLGAIALQGVRLAGLCVGEKVAIIGLGLIGLLTMQIVKAAGCFVIATDINEKRLQIAKDLGADLAVKTDEKSFIDAAEDFTKGRGVDAVILTAATKSNKPLEIAAQITRLKGRIIAVGDVGLNVPRREFYSKELELKVSMSFGPGRYDSQYEERGIDYPYAYVPFTEQRNMEAFLNLVASGKVRIEPLITHRCPIEKGPELYADILKNSEKYLGVTFTYQFEDEPAISKPIILTSKKKPNTKKDSIGIGLIGAGNFAKSIILPKLSKIEGVRLIGICTRTGATCKKTGLKHGFKYCTTRIEDILNDNEIDVVMIATRHDSHAALSSAALEAGKHVFVEKPLATNEEDLKNLLRTYEKSERILTVGFNRRFAQASVRAREMFLDHPAGLSMLYRINAGKVPRDHWVQDSTEGGGRIIGEVCHFVDFMQFICGSKPVAVQAAVAKSGEAANLEDNVSILIEFDDGSIGAINYYTEGSRAVPKEYIEIYGGGKTCIIYNFNKMTIAEGGKYKRKKIKRGKGHSEELISFFQCLREGEMPIPIHDMVYSTITTFRILDSLRSGMRESVCWKNGAK